MNPTTFRRLAAAGFPAALIAAVCALCAACAGGSTGTAVAGGAAGTGGEPAASVEALPAGTVMPSDADLPAALKKLEKDVAASEARVKKMKVKLGAFQPKGVHVVVDTGTIRLYLMNGPAVLREAVVSTGSGFRLVG